MRTLLVVVGAGASVDFGMPSVAEVGRILSRAAQNRFPLAAEPDTNLYDRVAGEIEAYWASFSKPSLARRPHFRKRALRPAGPRVSLSTRRHHLAPWSTGFA